MIYRSLIPILLLVFGAVIGTAQPLTPEQQATISNGAQGKEFWIAIPPNEINPSQTSSLEIYLASPFDTDVFLLDASRGVESRFSLKANVVKTLSDKTGETSWIWEIREFEQVVKKGIRLRSEKPFTVSVLNGKPFSSDGYLALPTSIWDTNYIVTTYYDFREFKPWACGFTVVAGEDDTRVRIQLRGTGQNEAATSGGKKINDGTFEITMNAGDVYHVAGDGQTRGVFDLTGTKVASNKPIGLISSHQRTTVPNLLVGGNGRDHLVEMNAPVSQWDTSYVTIELQREATNSQGRGDVFRVVAAEDDTRWEVKYYDKTTKTLLGQGGGILQAGEFADLSQAQNSTILTHGVSIWTANKPIQVVQFSTSSSFDGDEYHDPFMINLSPVDRFVHASVFQVPTDPKFTAHKLNLIINADTAEADYTNNLKSLEIDGVPVWNHPQSTAPTLLFNHMGNNLHWAQIDFGIEAKAHVIMTNGKISFGGYLYGFGNVDSYGWPLGPLHPNVVASDTAKPVITTIPLDSAGTGVLVTEKTNIPDPVRDRPISGDQVDAGIAEVGLYNEQNLRLLSVTPPGERREEAIEARYRLEVVDPESDASGTIWALDYAGNMSYENYVFTAQRSPEISAPTAINLGETGVDTMICATDQFVIRNVGNDTAWITGIEIPDKDSEFTIDTDACPLPIKIAPNDSVTLTCVCFVAGASGEYRGTILFTANDQGTPRSVAVSARVRENIQVSVQEEPVAANGLRVVARGVGQIVLEGGDWQPSTWRLFDLGGGTMASGMVPAGIGVELVNTTALPHGLYVLRLDGQGQTSSHKILVGR